MAKFNLHDRFGGMVFEHPELSQSKLEDLSGQIQQAFGRIRMKPTKVTARTLKNKFYVGHPKVTDPLDSWAKPTLQAAIDQAKEMLEKDKNRDHCAIVQIVRIVRRKDLPVIVEKVG